MWIVIINERGDRRHVDVPNLPDSTLRLNLKHSPISVSWEADEPEQPGAIDKMIAAAADNHDKLSTLLIPWLIKLNALYVEIDNLKNQLELPKYRHDILKSVGSIPSINEE
jgi:hypothetical protein